MSYIIVRGLDDAVKQQLAAQIAAICLTHGATCATRNVQDFQHTGVELVDPWKVDT